MGQIIRSWVSKTARGYRVVVQDVRGTFRSAGETVLAVNEAHDGYGTIDWITRQPWSDGTVGMWGESYYGFTQWAAVSTAHPALRAIVPRHTGTRLAEFPVTAPDAATTEAEWSFLRHYLLTHYHGRDDLEWELDWTRRPYADTVEELFAAVGARSASYDLTFPHPVRLRRFPEGHPFDAPPVWC